MDQQAIAQLLGNYGEFVGAIAVVVTLVYLTIQVRHNARTTLAQTNHSIARSLNELNIAVATDGGLSTIITRGIGDRSLLSPEEALRFDAFFNGILQCYQDMFLQHARGFDDQEHWSAAIPFIVNTLGTREMKAWWENQGRKIVLPTFASEVDRLLAAAVR